MVKTKRSKIEPYESKSQRYMDNAKKLLHSSPIEGDNYVDLKYVRQACGTAYLAILKSLDDYFLNHGFEKKRLPKSVEGYRAAIHKLLKSQNGRFSGDFEMLYSELHIAGYYRGLIANVDALHDIFASAERFIKKLD